MSWRTQFRDRAFHGRTDPPFEVAACDWMQFASLCLERKLDDLVLKESDLTQKELERLDNDGRRKTD